MFWGGGTLLYNLRWSINQSFLLVYGQNLKLCFSNSMSALPVMQSSLQGGHSLEYTLTLHRKLGQSSRWALFGGWKLFCKTRILYVAILSKISDSKKLFKMCLENFRELLIIEPKCPVWTREFYSTSFIVPNYCRLLCASVRTHEDMY